jgi:hypothetical protein
LARQPRENVSWRSPTSGAREHLDQRVNAESVDLAGHQVAHLWLAYAEELRRGSLGQFARANHPDEFDHQIRANAKTLRLVRRKPDVEEHVSARPLRSLRHR